MRKIPIVLTVAILAVGVAFADGVSPRTLIIQSGVCTLNAASPSICTVAVPAGTKCVATPVGSVAVTAIPVAVGLAGTVLTVTAANGATGDVNVLCY